MPGDAYVSELMVEGGVALKAAFGGLNGKPQWRPGIGFGYGTLYFVSVSGYEYDETGSYTLHIR